MIQFQDFAARRDLGGDDVVPDRRGVRARVAGERGGRDGEEQGRQDLRVVQGQLAEGEC